MTEQKQTIEPAKSTTDKHLVAVVVFCEADGVDEMDAGDAAVLTIRDRIMPGGWSALAPLKLAGGDGAVISREVKPIAVEEVGFAAANGHLVVKPTFRVRR